MGQASQIGAAELLITAMPGGIERLEAAGSQQVAAEQLLPREICTVRGLTLEALSTHWGFTILGESDELFMRVQLAPGWTLKTTEHRLYTDLFDDKGRRRAQIFYKAAPYDRRADLMPCTRYEVRCNYQSDPERRSRNEAIDHDGNVILEVGQWFSTASPRAAEDYIAQNTEADAMNAALTERFPDRKNPLAYWD